MRQFVFEYLQKILFKIRPDLVSIRFTYKSDLVPIVVDPPKRELSSEEYKERVLRPLGYKFVEPKPDQWMGATRDEWKIEAKPVSQ